MDIWRVFTIFGSAFGIAGLLWRIVVWWRSKPKIKVSTDVGYRQNLRDIDIIRIIAEHKGGPSVNLVRAGFESSDGKKWENIFQNQLPFWLHAGDRFFIPVYIEVIKREKLCPIEFAFFRGERNTTYKTRVSEQTNKLILRQLTAPPPPY